MMELRKLSIKMLNLAGLLTLIASGLHLLVLVIAFVMVKALNVHWDILDHFWREKDHIALAVISPIVSAGIGIFFLISAKKLKLEDRQLLWAVVPLVLGLITVFVVGSGSHVLTGSAGIVAIVGAGLSLYAILKEQPE